MFSLQPSVPAIRPTFLLHSSAPLAIAFKFFPSFSVQFVLLSISIHSPFFYDCKTISIIITELFSKLYVDTGLITGLSCVPSISILPLTTYILAWVYVVQLDHSAGSNTALEAYRMQGIKSLFAMHSTHCNYKD